MARAEAVSLTAVRFEVCPGFDCLNVTVRCISEVMSFAGLGQSDSGSAHSRNLETNKEQGCAQSATA